MGFGVYYSLSSVIVIFQLPSHVWCFATPWTTAHQASLFLTISQSLPKFTSIGLMMPSNHLIFCFPHLLLPSIFPSIGVFSNESALRIRGPEYWRFNFSFSISPSNEYPGLISFRVDWFDLLAVQGSLKSLLQHQLKSINSWVLIFLYGPILTFMHDYWTDHSLDYSDLCQQSDIFAFKYTV